MQAILTALLLVAVLVVSARVVIASDEPVGGDQDSFGAPDVIQTEPINLGLLWGPGRVPHGPRIGLEEDDGNR